MRRRITSAIAVPASALKFGYLALGRETYLRVASRALLGSCAHRVSSLAVPFRQKSNSAQRLNLSLIRLSRLDDGCMHAVALLHRRCDGAGSAGTDHDRGTHDRRHQHWNACKHRGARDDGRSFYSSDRRLDQRGSWHRRHHRHAYSRNHHWWCDHSRKHHWWWHHHGNSDHRHSFDRSCSHWCKHRSREHSCGQCYDRWRDLWRCHRRSHHRRRRDIR